MHTLIRVIVKEILQLRQDRRMIPIIFFAPVIQLVVFGFAVNTDVQDVPLVLVDQDRSPASRELLSDFVQSGYFELKGTEQDLRAVDRWLLTGDAQMALVIRQGYGDALAAGRTAPLQVIADGSDATSANVALGYAGRIVSARGAALMEDRRQTAGAARPGWNAAPSRPITANACAPPIRPKPTAARCSPSAGSSSSPNVLPEAGYSAATWRGRGRLRARSASYM